MTRQEVEKLGALWAHGGGKDAAMVQLLIDIDLQIRDLNAAIGLRTTRTVAEAPNKHYSEQVKRMFVEREPDF